MRPLARTLLTIAALGLLVGVAVAQPPNADKLSAARPSPPQGAPPQPSGNVLLAWDDGTAEGALGLTDGTGALATRFGGSSATTGAVPFKILGIYHFETTGTAPTSLAARLWSVVTPNLGGAQISSTPAAPALGTFGFASFANGPTITTPNGSIIAGVGGTGPSLYQGGPWRVGVDTIQPYGTGPVRAFGGLEPSTLTLKPPTMSFYFYYFFQSSGTWLIQLYVNANIPVELESFTIR